ncbi:MAG: LysM peptidoglycan-binding domain-containing protein [Bacteriovorax sp.]
MSRQNILKVLFLSLILSTLTSSCGLIEKWKTPEQPTDSKSATTETASTTADPSADDLFSQSMNDTKEEPSQSAKTDAPSNITTDKTAAPTAEAAAKDDLKTLENEFSGNAKQEQKEIAAAEPKQVKVEEALPEIKEEAHQPDMTNANAEAGKVLSYKVQKGETLMQIAFKIYGDIGKWKDLKQMNQGKLSKNSSLRANMELKYTAPEKNFVWNPEGTPYLIKNGETLGTISNSVYQTPKKWKKLWENNKPLIKNPNVIYAGFTLYYKGNEMANYVQPKVLQKKVALKPTKTEDAKIAEEIKVEQAISNLDKTNANEIDLTKDIQSAPIRDISQEVKADEQVDKALAH